MVIKTKLLENGTYNVYTPYNKDFVSRIKGIGGARWKASEKAWNIPAAGLGTARKFMMECYGECDIPEEIKWVTVRINFPNEYSSMVRSSIEAFGRTLAYAWGRDSGAKVGEDVILEEGEVTSGGSVKNWHTIIKAGSVFQMTIPEQMYEKEKDDWHVEIIDGEEFDKYETLTNERKKLLARLEEIDKELKRIKKGEKSC